MMMPLDPVSLTPVDEALLNFAEPQFEALGDLQDDEAVDAFAIEIIRRQMAMQLIGLDGLPLGSSDIGRFVQVTTIKADEIATRIDHRFNWG